MLSRVFIFCFLCTTSLLFGQISINNSSFTYTQNFNSLANSGTSNTTVPSGWAFSESGSNSNSTYAAGTGSDNAGNTYSFGLSGNSDRAFGGLLSGSLTPTIGVCFENNTGQVIQSISVSYTGETWRVGSANRTDGIQFQYNQSTTSITGGGTWILHPDLDYFNPGQPTGNGSMQHFANISNTITGLNIAPGSTFCFRWIDFNASSSDDGIGIDDFMITSIVLPVNFTHVKAKTVAKEVHVQFGTATEINNDYFTIERSRDGISFMALDRIEGQGNSSRITEYQYIDETPLSGNNFYRIKQTDFDGKSSYSAVVKASAHSTDHTIEVYSDGHVVYLASPDEMRKVSLFDMSGTRVFEKVVESNEFEIINEVNIPGWYVVRVETSGQSFQKLVWLM